MRSDGFVANLSLKFCDPWMILREIIRTRISMQKTQIKQILRSWGWQKARKMAGRFGVVAGGCAVGSQYCHSHIWLHVTSCVVNSSGWDYLHHHRRTLLTGCYQRQCVSMSSCLPRKPPFLQHAQRTISSQSSILSYGKRWHMMNHKL